MLYRSQLFRTKSTMKIRQGKVSELKSIAKFCEQILPQKLITTDELIDEYLHEISRDPRIF